MYMYIIINIICLIGWSYLEFKLVDIIYRFIIKLMRKCERLCVRSFCKCLRVSVSSLHSICVVFS